MRLKAILEGPYLFKASLTLSLAQGWSLFIPYSLTSAHLARSTGGIIAMGLGVEQWSVVKCIEHFRRLTDKAFTPRWPALARLGRRYKTRPFEEALQETFHDEYLFGGEHEEPSNIKVAITATSETGESPVIFTNYNRQVETQRKSIISCCAVNY
jgi:hypothetical protein